MFIVGCIHGIHCLHYRHHSHFLLASLDLSPSLLQLVFLCFLTLRSLHSIPSRPFLYSIHSTSLPKLHAFTVSHVMNFIHFYLFISCLYRSCLVVCRVVVGSVVVYLRFDDSTFFNSSLQQLASPHTVLVFLRWKGGAYFSCVEKSSVVSSSSQLSSQRCLVCEEPCAASVWSSGQSISLANVQPFPQPCFHPQLLLPSFRNTVFVSSTSVPPASPYYIHCALEY